MDSPTLQLRRVSELDRLPWFEKGPEGNLRLASGQLAGPALRALLA